MLKGTWRRGWGRDWVWEGGLGERVDGKRIRADWGEGCWGKERGPEIGEGWKRHKREERWTPCEFEMGVWTGDLEEEIPITFPVPFCALWPHITLAGLWQSEGSLLPSIPQQNCFLTTGCGEGNGTPLQYSCLENPMDGGAWWAAVHGVAKSQTRLK